MRAKDKMQVTLKVSTAQPHVLVQHRPIKVAVGGLIVSSLCGGSSVGGITVPSMDCLWSLVWRLSACLESGIIFHIHFIMQNPSKILLKLKLGNSKVLQITS